MVTVLIWSIMYTSIFFYSTRGLMVSSHFPVTSLYLLLVYFIYAPPLSIYVQCQSGWPTNPHSSFIYLCSVANKVAYQPPLITYPFRFSVCQGGLLVSIHYLSIYVQYQSRWATSLQSFSYVFMFSINQGGHIVSLYYLPI